MDHSQCQLTDPLRVCTRTYKDGELYGEEEGIDEDNEDWEGDTYEVPGEDGSTVVRGGATKDLFRYASSALFELDEQAIYIYIYIISTSIYLSIYLFIYIYIYV